MDNRNRVILRWGLLTLAVVFGLGASAKAQGFATLEATAGQVVVVRQGQSQPVSPGMVLQLNDIVVTRLGRASVRFEADGTVLRIGPDSRVQVNESAAQRDITVFFGRLWAHVVRWKERPTRFSTAGTIAAVRGTELSLAVETDGDRTQLAVLEGKVHAENDAGSLELVGGQSATARKGTAPARGVAVKAKDAVQWALYYPPVLAPKAGETVPAEGASVSDARLLNLRASQLLATGSVDQAARDLEQAEKLAAGNSDTLALQSIVAIARTENEKALSLARRAVTADPQSAAAQVALSYARQASFDLEGARASAEKATTLAADDALAWARLAEVRSSLGDLDGALVAARKSADLAPGLSRAQTVLGFAHLTRVHTAEARTAFAKAVELDSSDPLPRLGLGLAQIRDGKLAEGSKEIEVAVSLDPGQSLLRSYLGKAYFESKREDLVGREYDLAKQADPKDPTPWLYDAISKQTTNRPVEALKDNQKAIELNDNRAVYRSRLLLDSDEAARSAALGRVYSDLGFQNRALVEGWTSVNTDATNYSAHRFLADSYAALPRHEVARVSELLQSQLLQPLNMTPIQPRLGESNLFLISGGGPASLSFNEFNPLFSRDGVSLLGTGLAGEDGLWSGEGTVAGIYKKMSFSAGYNQFSTDGWREHAFQDDKIANAFVQFEISPDTSIQAEYRYRDRASGDIQQRFFEEDFNPGQRDELTRNTYRIGGRHSFSPGSVLLVSATGQDADGLSRVDEFAGPGTFSEAKSSEKDYGIEAEYLFRSQRLDISAGVGYFNIDGEILLRLALPGGPPGGPGAPPDDPNAPPSGPPDAPFGGPTGVVEQEFPPITNKYDHVNGYVYANIKPVTNVVLTIGGSLDSLSGDVTGGDVNQFNPKVGVIANLDTGTTIRGAVFRTLKRTLVTDQTLEPTQVGGFNQFFDDSFVTDAWRYGGGIDQKLGRNAFLGAELSKRDLEFPYLFGPEVQTATWDEWLGRGYLFVAPHPWVALRAQYLYEKYERVQEPALGFTELKTHRVPLGLGFFHPSGLNANVTVTYWKQDGQFAQGPPGFPPVPGSSDFWLVDAALTFRLPKRFGFIAIGAANLFDEKFQYYEVDFENPTITPKRSVYARITLAVP